MLGEMTSELVKYRGLLGMLAWRDIRVRYKQSLLGVTWAFLMPLIQTAVLFAVFTMGPVQIPQENLKGMPYLLFLMTGVVAWGLFSGTISSSIESLTRNSRLVTKIYFPREVFPLASVTGTLVDFAIAVGLLVPFYIYFSIPEASRPWGTQFPGTVDPGAMMLLLPAILLVQVLLISGLSLILSMANLFYRDVKYITMVVLQLWFFATNVAYPIRFESYPMLRWLASANPMIPILDAYRDILKGVPIENVGGLVVATVISVVVFFFGWVVFHKAEFKFAEYV